MGKSINVVQIGANRGYDDATELIKNKNINNLILVEPFYEHNESLKECYSNIENKIIENIIIHDNKELSEVEIYYHEEDSNHTNSFELASLDKGHSIKIRPQYNENGIVARKLKCTTLNNLFDKYNLQTIDLLMIDTEGYDCRIIKSIDFHKYLIKEIYYENLHCNVDEIENILINNGYKIYKNVFSFGWSNKAELI